MARRNEVFKRSKASARKPKKEDDTLLYFFEATNPATDELVTEYVSVISVTAKGQYRISKEEAERLLRKWKYDLPFEIMCKKYGRRQNEVEEDEWVGVYCDDLVDENGEEDPNNGKLTDDCQTLEIWDEHFMQKVVRL